METNANGEAPRPMVGIGVLIRNGKGEVLLGQRQGSHGAGLWALPGGHLEFGETVFETAKREVKEETDLDVEIVKLVSVFDVRTFLAEGKHYVDLGVLAESRGGEPKVVEPRKCAGWKWFAPDALPEGTYEGTRTVVRNYLAGTVYVPPAT